MKQNRKIDQTSPLALADVVSFSGIDHDEIAFLDEEGNLDGSASFNGGIL